MEEIITEKSISVIKDEDRKLESKMSGAYKSELMSTIEEITSNDKNHFVYYQYGIWNYWTNWH